MNVSYIEENLDIITLLDNIPEGFFIYKFNPISDKVEFISWNKKMLEITGYTIYDVQNCGWLDLLYNIQSIDNFYNIFSKPRGKAQNEYEILTKDNIKKMLTISTSVITTLNGEKNYLVIVKDITKTKQLEYELREIEERYNKVLELSTDAIIIHKEGKYLNVNNNALSMLGIKDPKEVIGQSILKFIHPNFHDIANKRINNALYNKIPVPIIEEKLIAPNGEIIDVEIASSYVPYNGELCGLTFVRNINNRKKMENDLRESKERLLQVTENTLDMITISDLNGIITYATPSNKFTLGYELDDFIGMNVIDLIHPDDLHDSKFFLKNMIKIVKGRTVQCRCKCSDGSYKHLEIKSKILCKNSAFESIIFSSRDISERIKAEELEKDMKEKSRLLNEANEYELLRTEFFANISHELRTPINVILSSLQLLNQYIATTNNDSLYEAKYKKYSSIMKQNCYRLVRLINNLIDVTKIDSGYFELNLINANIINIVEDITLSVSEYIENKGIHLEFDTEIEERILACDPDKIERIILNLISNSIKFTQSGGHIYVNIVERDNYLTISVKDTGIGISKDKQGLIFERFVQADKSLTRNREGSGIGLSLVKSLVELHKGSINLKSELNKGSEFIIKLPIYLINNNQPTFETDSYNLQGRVEKINIEFSDIYY